MEVDQGGPRCCAVHMHLSIEVCTHMGLEGDSVIRVGVVYFWFLR